jgi:hypothetical protein
MMLFTEIMTTQSTPKRLSRWRVLAAVMFLFLAFAPLDPSIAGSVKKGIGLSKCSSTHEALTRAEQLHPSWYYNWSPIPSFSSDHPIRFVPMIWGKGKKFPDHLAAVQGADFLLTFNEPDHGTKQYLSVDEVAEVWPRLRAAAERLSSPAAGRPLGPWMKEFHLRAQSEKLEYEFVAVHWYGKPDPKRFLRFLRRVNEAYGKPLWITEFAVADWESAKKGRKNRFTPAITMKFMREVLPELEKLDYVERYAWFGIPCRYKEAIANSMFFASDGTLTELGRLYASF